MTGGRKLVRLDEICLCVVDMFETAPISASDSRVVTHDTVIVERLIPTMNNTCFTINIHLLHTQPMYMHVPYSEPMFCMCFTIRSILLDLTTMCLFRTIHGGKFAIGTSPMVGLARIDGGAAKNIGAIPRTAFFNWFSHVSPITNEGGLRVP